jgi:hypothetical protein
MSSERGFQVSRAPMTADCFLPLPSRRRAFLGRALSGGGVIRCCRQLSSEQMPADGG